MSNENDNDTANSTLYFGYGSNLWQHQMRQRCPTSKYLGIARLEGWRWIINSRGYANVVEINSTSTTIHEGEGQEKDTKDSPSGEVWGLVYTLETEDERRLDVNEGVPIAYTKETHNATLWPSHPGVGANITEKGEAKAMLVYVDRNNTTPHKPKKEYVYRMNMGLKDALKEGVPESYVRGVVRRFIPEEDGDVEGGYVMFEVGLDWLVLKVMYRMFHLPKRRSSSERLSSSDRNRPKTTRIVTITGGHCHAIGTKSSSHKRPLSQMAIVLDSRTWSTDPANMVPLFFHPYSALTEGEDDSRFPDQISTPLGYSSRKAATATMAAPCDTRSKVTFYMTPDPGYNLPLPPPAYAPVRAPAPLPACQNHRVKCPFYTNKSRCENLPGSRRTRAPAGSKAARPNAAYRSCFSCADQAAQMLYYDSNLRAQSQGRVLLGSPQGCFHGGAHYLGLLCPDCKNAEFRAYHQRLCEHSWYGGTTNAEVLDFIKETAASTCKCEAKLIKFACYGHRMKILDEMQTRSRRNVAWLERLFLAPTPTGGSEPALAVPGAELNAIRANRAALGNSATPCRCGREIPTTGFALRGPDGYPTLAAYCTACDGAMVDYETVHRMGLLGTGPPAHHALRRSSRLAGHAVWKKRNLKLGRKI
ncbi:uncharacterized protein LTR77_007838 [Saxophila tyrrhenica]|uniref:gamma-glutamylcyclotransferase n=1 Tax=Saxophila tyrrhenica TaxID=1690608 RepID=A0AAV9P746_9PEZI|nr:hypothetical protein LTR77_007838 [Saxophila tyrrhenica]